MKNRHLLKKIKETLYIEQSCLSPLQSRHFGTSHNSPNLHQLPHHIFLNFTDGEIKISSLSKVILVLGKARSLKDPNLGSWRAKSPGWFDVSPKTCDEWAGILSSWSCQSPVAHSCSLLNHPNRCCEGMFKLNIKYDAHFYSLSHFESNSHTVQRLTKQCLLLPLTSTVKSSLFTHVHSSPFSLAASLHWYWANHSPYINNGLIFSRQIS